MPIITAIVPARNEEANIARCVESLAAQAEIGEIIVVNDESSDGTAAILAEFMERIPRLTVIESGGVPRGWLGKNHAVWLGAQRATGEWLLFTDADTTHYAGGAAQALRDAQRTGAELVSYSPEQQTETWWERALVPFVFCRLAQLFPYHTVSDPASSVAAANGQYLMIRRDVYEHLGTHAAVKSEVVEDLALARLAKSRRIGIHFARGQGIVSARMYRTLAAMWEGWSKGLYELVGGTRGAFVRELMVMFPWAPVILLALSGLHVVFPLLGVLMLALRHAAYAMELRRNHYPASGIVYYIPGLLLYCAALAESARCHARGRVMWKGRDYTVQSGS
ncbi:MAG: glycosyltransferase [Verrucomicrobiales bacterium]|nr:glycosyltransferase [Verrucomicrobiales bacterium]